MGGVKKMDYTHERIINKLDRLIKLLEEKNKKPDSITAEWMISSDGYYPYCSRCKDRPQNGRMTKYCSNCGAKMY